MNVLIKCTRCGNDFPAERRLGRSKRCQECRRLDAREAQARLRTKTKVLAPDGSAGSSRVCCACRVEKPIAEFGRHIYSPGGVSRRCAQCNREYSKSRYRADLEKNRAENTERQRRRRASAPQKVRAYRLKWWFDMELSQFEGMLASQNGLCAVCKRPETNAFKGKVRDLCVDHDHETGAIRGLLCTRCNRALGLLGDDPKIVWEMARYIDKHKSGPERTSSPN